MKTTRCLYRITITLLVLAGLLIFPESALPMKFASAQADDNPAPPEETVKLIFIHHSCGENWLTDGNGDLGIALGENNYFASDTNYGWGPDSIGDNTDIIHWPDWFRGPESPRYMAALYSESGQRSNYTRSLADPGGENQIVLFKSCFPNSNLQGQPDDPPTPGLDFTVGNAKYIYNDLLKYFSTRPDILFVAITAPPVVDAAYAKNARAFSAWLVEDWLKENNYPLNNVAVWDFHAVLTHRDNHHRFIDGKVEYINDKGKGTSAYATSRDDDHPNADGNRKATEEFVPMLNVFYHRWKSSAPAQVPVTPTSPFLNLTPLPGVEAATFIAPDRAPGSAAGLVDDFESGAPSGSPGWQGFSEDGSQTSITCSPESGAAHGGNAAMHITFSVAANSWGMCSLLYDGARDWRSAAGLSFAIHASQPNLPVDIVTYGGAPGALEQYESTIETTQAMVDGWVVMDLPWDMLKRVAWEENAGSPFDPARVAGVALGMGAFPERTSQGEIWIDDVRLAGGAAPQPAAATKVPEPVTAVTVMAPAPADTPEGEKGGGGGFCPLSTAMVVMVGAFGWWYRRGRQNT